MVLALPNALQAQQSASTRKIDFGVKIGVNIAKLHASNTYSEKNIIGIYSGIFIRMPLYHNFLFQPELCFMGNGSELVYNNIILGAVKYNLSYLQLPILVDYKLFDYLHLQAGPYVSRLLNTDIANTKTNNSFNFEQNIAYADFNKYDAGLIGGASFHWKMLTVGARYNLGLVQAANEKSISGNNYSFANGTNRAASIFVALMP